MDVRLTRTGRAAHRRWLAALAVMLGAGLVGLRVAVILLDDRHDHPPAAAPTAVGLGPQGAMHRQPDIEEPAPEREARSTSGAPASDPASATPRVATSPNAASTTSPASAPRRGARGHGRLWTRSGAPAVHTAETGDATTPLRDAGTRHATGTPPATTPRDVPPADPALDAPATSYPTNAVVEIPEVGKIASGAGTVSFWLEPGWQTGNQDDAAFVQLGDMLQVVKNVDFLRLEAAQENGVAGIGTAITEWTDGERHQVAATWNGNHLTLYLDGQLVSQTDLPAPVKLPPDASLFVGSDFPANRPVAPGAIADLAVRGRALRADEVAAAYRKATEQPAAPATH
ncbi:MAG: LamG-like jellyroll fold domain-containing protein [Candidatus Binatia bacterium]